MNDPDHTAWLQGTCSCSPPRSRAHWSPERDLIFYTPASVVLMTVEGFLTSDHQDFEDLRFPAPPNYAQSSLSQHLPDSLQSRHSGVHVVMRPKKSHCTFLCPSRGSEQSCGRLHNSRSTSKCIRGLHCALVRPEQRWRCGAPTAEQGFA